MKRSILFVILAITAAMFAACGAPADNKPTNTNTNTAKPVASAPTADMLLALDKDATEKYVKGDGAAFETILADKAVLSMGKDRMGKAAIVAMIKTVKCEGVTVNLSEPQMSKINDDTYAIVFKNESKGKCSEGKDGAMVDFKPTRAATVWVRNGDKWQAAWHEEVEIMAPPAGDKKDDKAAEAKKEEPKKEEAKPAEPKKDEKAAETKDAKPAANSNTAAAPEPAKLTPSANTEALTKLHASGWEAFKNKDAKAFESMMAAAFSGVAPDGSVLASRDAAIKEWTGAGKMKCEGVTKTSFTDGFAQAISPTVEILFGKGNSDGKCNEQPNGDLYQTAVYVKEGDAWKLAFIFETMPTPAK